MNTTDEKRGDPLRAILGENTEEINRERLARLLKPFVRLEEAGGKFGFLPPFHKLKNLERIEIVLASSKARALLIEGWKDSTTPSSIISLQVMPVGSAKSTLKGLLDAHLVAQDKEGGYYLPNYRLDELCEKFTKIT